MAASTGSSSVAKTIALLLGIASLGLAGFAIWIMLAPGSGKSSRVSSSSNASSSATPAPSNDGSKTPWVASAPGRVEPRSGVIRISAGGIGRVTALPVKLNDKVTAGQLLLVMEDKDARARLTAAEAEAAARKRERDAAPANAGRENVSRAEDNLYNAERTYTSARIELDDATLVDPKGTSPAVTSSRKRMMDAQDRVRQEQTNLTNALRNNSTAASRADSAVIAARADVMLADQAWDKTRIRAPIAGSVLQINTKVGEFLAASPELIVFAMGDVSRLRVRAEVDETEVNKIRLGQTVFVKNSAFPGQEFEGKVSELTPLLAIPRMAARGPRRPSDVEVMEVLIDLEGTITLLPGMRVDAFFR